MKGIYALKTMRFLLPGICLVQIVLLAFATLAVADVESGTDGKSIHVRKHERQTIRAAPVPSPKAPSSRAESSSTTNEGTGSSSNSNGGSSRSGSSEEPLCLNRIERFAAFREGRECDTSIAPFAMGSPANRDPAPVANQPAVVNEPVEIVITASDLLELIPSSPEILMDRGPFGLKNAHTNFYASNSGPQTVTQTMFGQQVTITATPVEYRWDYGDGNTLATDLPGHPVDVFNTETDTSHQYSETGLYSVRLTTEFEGTYQVDGGEVQTVSSTVTQQADPVEIRIWRAVTRNVDQTCQQNPQAWGC